ncbi:hypothetical protein BaRGS_00018045, partial [Batillaria attramentaria]
VWEKKVKVVYLLRNPKDVWVSLYHQTNKHRGPLGYEGTWNQFFSLMISFGYWFGDWFDYTLGWEREMEGTEVPIFTSYYEDMKKDPVGQIEKLDQFLGYNRGRQMYEAIADACSFSKLKKVKDVVTTEEVKKLFKDDAMGIFRKATMASPFVELKDKFGNDISFGQCGDILIPAFPGIPDFRKHRDNIKDLELKPDDVIIAGFPKTGTHWHYEILHMLISGTPDYRSRSETNDFIDMTPQEKGSNPPGSEPRVYYTHLKFHHLPRQVWEKKVKVVYLMRNPKDTLVSMYNHQHGAKGRVGYHGTWDQFFFLVMTFGGWYGDWFDYVLDWERAVQSQTEVPILTSVYEDMKKDPVGQIEKLDKFLGYNRGRQLCEAVADACNFSKMKQVKDSQTSTEVKSRVFKENAPGFYRK